ncbi:hypothetical protein TYRP_009212, partial [Tyrophagus putrescentiae]
YEYQVLISNLVYVGSGRSFRPFEHIIQTNYVLSGQYITGTQPIHMYLARGVLEDIFKKVLIVSFFGSNNYPACLYSEQATAWVLRKHLVNSLNFVELGKLRHKLCVEPSNPEIYLKNCFSKQAMQFVADYNVEAAIRQIGKFGIVLSLSNPNENGVWKDQISFKSQPYIHSAFSITADSTLFYRFGTPFYDETNIIFQAKIPELNIEIGEEKWFQTNYFRMLPFQKVDFIFKEDDWIERVRLANEIENKLKSTLSVYPSLLKASFQELEITLTYLKAEKLNESSILTETINKNYAFKLST